jgi:UDP-3-O-[3-hydroxymyristoyl] N-acetylglucosamine deacetylase
VGDLALAGHAIHGRFVGHRSGHALNNRLLRALFAEAGAHRLTGDAELALTPASDEAPAGVGGGQLRLPAAAAPSVA